MPAKEWPAEARRLYRTLYRDEDAECLRGLPLKAGIGEAFFAELVVGCLHNYIERAKRWDRADRLIHQTLHRTNCDHERGIHKAEKAWPAKAWPWPAPHAKRALRRWAEGRRAHEKAAAWAKGMAAFLDPVVCLHALFSGLVATRRDQGIEFYMTSYFPRILTAAGMDRWTALDLEATPDDREVGERRLAGTIGRHFRRKGGKGTSEVVAYYLFSTAPRLLRYRPARPKSLPDPDPQNAALIDSAMGAALFRLPAPRTAAPRKTSRGGQHSHKMR